MTLGRGLAFLGCLPFFLVSARADDTCSNDVLAGDRDLWSANPFMAERDYRDLVADYYGLNESDWDGGWGWVKYNDPEPFQYAYPKMMSAAKVLWSGIDDALSLQGTWSVESRDSGTLADRRLRVVSRTGDSIDLLYRDGGNGLVHEALSGGADWYPGAFPSSREVRNVSELVRTAKDRFRITGDPVVLSRGVDSLDAFARSGDALYHFSWTAATGWTAENLTALTARTAPLNGHDRFFIAGDPVAVTRAPDKMDVFAVDEFHHLLHYRWSAAAGWGADDLTQATNAHVWVKGDPVVAARGGDALDVFVRCTPENRVWDKHLVRFSWASGSSWKVEDLTQQLGSAGEIEGQPAAIPRGTDEVHVFARNDNHLRHFAWSGPSGWTVDDLTDATRVAGPCAGGYCSYSIDGDPVALNPPTLGSLHVFARDLNNLLTHYFTDASGWHAEDLSSRFGCPSVAGDPVVLSRGASRVDVFASDSIGYLTHCYWTPELGWLGERPTAVQDGLAPRTIDKHPAPVSRSDQALDVFGVRLGLFQDYAHYTAAMGRTVNPWHGNDEYSRWAAGSLHHFRYKPTNDAELAADSTRWIFCMKERVQFGCIGFNEVGPAERASIMLHEATHLNYDDFSHEDNAGGTGEHCDESCSDYWLPHGTGDPAGCVCGGIGEEGACAWGTGYVLVPTHSPYQIQVEYLCDLGEFPRWDLPLSVYNGMSDRANTYRTTRILDPPGWTCGEPRPLP